MYLYLQYYLFIAVSYPYCSLICFSPFKKQDTPATVVVQKKPSGKTTSHIFTAPSFSPYVWHYKATICGREKLLR